MIMTKTKKQSKTWAEKYDSFVSITPIATVLLLEGANIQQLWRMWSEKTSAGQSLTGWIFVWLALFLWIMYYMNKLTGKDRTIAVICTAIGILLNTCVIISVIYWRING